jgi:hypothetical protein
MKSLPHGLRIASGLLGAFFVFGALVQLNDPDPVQWIAIYVAAAALAFAAVRAALPPWLPALLGVIAVAWAVAILPGALRTSFPEMFRSYRMMGAAMEEGRETLGLAVIAAWMATLAIASKRARA